MGNYWCQTVELTSQVVGAIHDGNLLLLKELNEAANESSIVSDNKRFLGLQLHAAIEEGHLKCLSYLLQIGADPCYYYCVDRMTPLHHAVLKGKRNVIETCRILLDAKADINAQNIWGRTPLISAIVNFKTMAAEFLIGENANLNIQDESGTTPLMVCASYNNHDLLKKLLLKDANINQVDAKGRTALHFAVVGKHIGVIKELVSCNCMLSTYDVYGHTPLHAAITKCHTEITDILIHGGIRVISSSTHIIDLCFKIVHSTVTRCLAYHSESDCAQAISSLECMHQVLIAMGPPLKKSIYQKALRLEKSIPKLDSLPECVQRVVVFFNKVTALVAQITAKNPKTMDTLQNLSRRACRQATIASGHNVTWAVHHMDIHTFLKDLILFKS
ncbi:hypothetical protein FSP39_014157 [Pinctada imbricata]|uniref:Uncharacterized protein n=1 Tax=Pinctada imbricata TaxID=66713 RepID=A0AA88Y0H2_PINIB|nr:hypothetical protein FSP39_014157 [Pinctada imbricata]